MSRLRQNQYLIGTMILVAPLWRLEQYLEIVRNIIQLVNQNYSLKFVSSHYLDSVLIPSCILQTLILEEDLLFIIYLPIYLKNKSHSLKCITILTCTKDSYDRCYEMIAELRRISAYRMKSHEEPPSRHYDSLNIKKWCNHG